MGSERSPADNCGFYFSSPPNPLLSPDPVSIGSNFESHGFSDPMRIKVKRKWLKSSISPCTL